MGVRDPKWPEPVPRPGNESAAKLSPTDGGATSIAPYLSTAQVEAAVTEYRRWPYRSTTDAPVAMRAAIGAALAHRDPGSLAEGYEAMEANPAPPDGWCCWCDGCGWPGAPEACRHDGGCANRARPRLGDDEPEGCCGKWRMTASPDTPPDVPPAAS